MKRSDLTEFAIEEEGFKLKICRGAESAPALAGGRILAAPTLVEVPSATNSAAAAAAPAKADSTAAPAAGEAQEEAGITYIKSPMVGTFYRAASPENPPFIDIGAKVEEKTVVCIIEAMKIMNEIQAETKGTLIEILVENGQPVEYGQRLFKVKAG